MHSSSTSFCIWLALRPFCASGRNKRRNAVETSWKSALQTEDHFRNGSQQPKEPTTKRSPANQSLSSSNTFLRNKTAITGLLNCFSHVFFQPIFGVCPARTPCCYLRLFAVSVRSTLPKTTPMLFISCCFVRRSTLILCPDPLLFSWRRPSFCPPLIELTRSFLCVEPDESRGLPLLRASSFFAPSSFFLLFLALHPPPPGVA